MIIRHVKLTNILSHENSEAVFPDGIVAIVGPNGAGKSSIIDSIYTALFTDATIDIRGRKKEFLVMRGKKRGEIEVSLEVGGTRYQVTKEINVDAPAQATLYMVEKGVRKAKSVGVSNVVSELGKILGLSVVSVRDLRNVVRSTIISLQDELTKIVDITDSERREWILSLLGLSYLEKSLEVVKKFTNKKDKLEGRLESERDELNTKRRELNELESRKVTLTSKLSELNLILNELRKKHEIIYEKVGLANEAMELVDKLRALIIAKRIKELQDLMVRLGVLEGFDINEYLRVRVEYEKRIKELLNYKNQFDTLLQNISSKLGVHVSNYESLNTLLKELMLRNDELNESISRGKALKDLYTLYIEKFESTKECPICGSLIKEPAVIKGNLSRELSKLIEKIKELSNESSNIKTKIEYLQSYLDRLGKLANTIEVLEKLISEMREKLNSLSDKAIQICRNLSDSFENTSNDLIDKCADYLSSQKDKLNKIKGELELLSNLRNELMSDVSLQDIEVLQGRLGGIFMELDLNIKVLEKLEDADSSRRELMKKIRELNQELESVRGKISDAERGLAELEAVLKELDGRAKILREEVKESEKRIAELENQIKAYTLIHEFFNRYLGKNGLIARELTKMARDELERRTNRILVKLGLRPIEINEEFQIRIRVLGGELPINNASGGEKVGISIALRLALAELIMGRSPTTLILDEPTVYLDDERRRQIFDIIRELSKSLKQIIVVTHDESVIDIANNIIRVENVGEVSRVTQDSLQ
ncbi:MAG: AAA family ATPase [Sulfolobales archaeon]